MTPRLTVTLRVKGHAEGPHSQTLTHGEGLVLRDILKLGKELKLEVTSKLTVPLKVKGHTRGPDSRDGRVKKKTTGLSQVLVLIQVKGKMQGKVHTQV